MTVSFKFYLKLTSFQSSQHIRKDPNTNIVYPNTNIVFQTSKNEIIDEIIAKP